jgi:hypothetical protein
MLEKSLSFEVEKSINRNKNGKTTLAINKERIAKINHENEWGSV